MSNEQNQFLESILQELKNITAELQLLRSELRLSPYARSEKTVLSSSPRQVVDSLEKTEGERSDETVLAGSPGQVVDSPDETEEEKALAVYDWLTARGITVKNYREQSAVDAVFDQLAMFLGERFKNLSRIYESIKRSLSQGGSVTLNLSSSSQSEIAESTQFCTMLYSYAFLSSYHYNKPTKTIYAAPQRVGKVINFFTGGWFERYIYLKIFSFLVQNRLEFTCLLNPQITFPNGDDFELDVLFLVNNQPLWLECKTGEYQTHVAKYSNARKVLGIPKQRAVLVVLDISEDISENLTSLYDITVANENNFTKAVLAAVGLSQYQESVAPSYPTITATPGGLSTLLNKASLRPVPEYRQQVINELITLVSSLNQPVSITEVKSVLAEKVQASKSQLQDILNAIVRGGCLLDDNGLTVLSFTSPFSKLVSHDPAVIESKCIESYVRAVLLTEPTYFENPSNIDEFQRVVGGTAPDMTTISKLREQLFRPDAAPDHS
jgi:hypothetical protein